MDLAPFFSISPLREAVAAYWKRELLKTLWSSQDSPTGMETLHKHSGHDKKTMLT